MYRLSLFFTSNGRKDILPVLVLFLSLSCTQFWCLSTPTFRSSRSQLFFEIGAFKNFAIFTGNHLRWSLQEVPAQAFSCEFCEQFLLESTSSGCFCTFPRLLQIVTISNFNLSLSKRRLVKKTSRYDKHYATNEIWGTWKILLIFHEKKSPNYQFSLHNATQWLPKIPQFHLISSCENFLERRSFRIALGDSLRNYVETVPFHKISTPGNQVKLWHFTQWMLCTE